LLPLSIPTFAHGSKELTPWWWYPPAPVQRSGHKQPGGLFIEPTFSTFAFFVIVFLPQITVFLHCPESAISLKSTRVLLSGNVKNPSGALFFSALSGLDNLCSELGQVFVGTVLPSPLPSPNVRPNLAIEQGWIRSTLRMKSLRQGSFDQPPNIVNRARVDINCLSLPSFFHIELTLPM